MDGHVNIAMVEDIGSNGTTGSNTGAPSASQSKQGCGSTVSFHSVHYRVLLRTGFLCSSSSSSREILQDLNGMMRPGLNAVLGPTGSGKSSFLDILAARKEPEGLSGEVLIDGAPQPPNFKCLSGYVVQEDVVMGTLTVRQNLSFSAALRLPSSVPQREKEARVSHLIEELGLTKVADSKVGTQTARGISGGERKRTNIGMELVIDPAVLFLDEPTTGLDASTANSVLMLLKRMAGQGRTIIMSIHQPRYSIYRLFDTLTLLVNGKMAYHGPAPNALDYFANIAGIMLKRPADFFLDVINGDFTEIRGNDLDFEELGSTRRSTEERLMDEYRSSSYAADTRAELTRVAQNKEFLARAKSRTVTYNTSFFHQLRWVFQRTFQNLMLNPQTSVAQLGVNIFLALVVGAIFFGVKDDQSGIQNRSENSHEYISGYYRVSVYFLSKILADLAMRTATSVIFSVVVYFLIGLKPTGEAFLVFTLTVTLVAYTATALTMVISADQSVVGLANIFMTITFVFMMVSFGVLRIFSGLLVNLPSIVDWLEWLKYFSIPRYGFAVIDFCLKRSDYVSSTQALKINEFVGLKFCSESVTQHANASSRSPTGQT
uniref:Broad substrate specificity ATP-binding cassette transporter ABCG2 n=1 Tax=Kryptolebias marmoratus TaxID=37003 RepID=A0A3Q3EPU9_KRYMA